MHDWRCALGRIDGYALSPNPDRTVGQTSLDLAGGHAVTALPVLQRPRPFIRMRGDEMLKRCTRSDRGHTI
jgi:hypothetical protein